MESEALLWSQPDWTGHLDVYKEDARVWERRFFLLQGSFLFSFKNELDRSSPLGVIALEGCQVEEVPGDASRKHKLVVKLGPEYAAFGNHDQYFLSTSSSESLRSAIRRLEDASDPPEVLFRYLNKTWARAGELRHLLAKSPNDKTELESIKSLEAQSVKVTDGIG
ncbi:sesquipedalian-1-like isoform X2 [Selaginella moellendorffii]|uniref:sesquipedalian-1-like isoform X2 n=1 Tax=Selaginella moellendorffii TaxID=88036 RepID=UPI000D1CA7D4|nr:sesquipedalian-1-like isoform X2 [Selaginella moellendorffii]|eukprot:XP_024518378.1 sesquipedalian-1-like isoform X2 [Selaginella moellendorffii]